MNILDILKTESNIYTIDFGNEKYTFRGLSLKESKYFLSLINESKYPNYLIYEQIFDLVFVGDLNFIPDSFPIGQAITIGELSVYLSLDKEKDDILFDIAASRKKNALDTLETHMLAVIVTAFPSYKYNEIQQLSKKDFIDLFVISENILTKTKHEFIRLDLKKIYDSMYEKEIKEEEKNQTVQETTEEEIGMNHFVNDSDQLRGAVGYWEVQEAEEKVRKEQEEQLKLKILRELDARNKRG